MGFPFNNFIIFLPENAMIIMIIVIYYKYYKWKIIIFGFLDQKDQSVYSLCSD